MEKDGINREANLMELCVLAQTGDGMAYRELLSETVSILQGYLGKRVTNKSVLEDVMQEILISIHKGLHTYIPGRRFSSWLFAIAKNRLYDYYRKSCHLNQEVSFATEHLDEFVFEPELPFLEGEIEETIEKALNALPTNYAQAVRMTKLEGKSIKDASKSIGISESALKVTVHRAYKMLRDYFENNWQVV